MGCYDSIYVNCPKCGERSEFQSKGGECLLQDYTLETAPPEVLQDVNRHAPNECQKCGSWFYVDEVGRNPTVVQCGRPVAEEKGMIPYRLRGNRPPLAQ